MPKFFLPQSAAVLSMVALICLATGCGGKTVPVNGHVKFRDGGDVGVLRGYVVSFEPEDERISATGEIDAAGKFNLSTFGPNDGALPGRHRVAISAPDPPPDSPPLKPVIPQKYREFSTSGLKVEIKPGQTNNVEFELERMP